MSNEDDDDKFEWPVSSTHFKNWLLDSEESLKKLQAKTYTDCAQKIKERHPNLKIPSLEEELWLIKYYSHQLSRFLTTNNLKTTVKESSLSLFNRFYLKRSLLQWDPRIIMFTCITLATKLEDMWRSVYVDKLLGSVEDLDVSSKTLKFSSQHNYSEVFEMESIVCDAMNFNLFILHTTDSIYSIIQMLIEVSRSTNWQYLKESLDLDDSSLNQHLNIILNMLKQSETNSINMHEWPEFIFLYTPTQLALANVVYYIKNSLTSVVSIDMFILKKLLNNEDKYLLPLMNKLNKIIDQYEDFIKVRSELSSQENRDKARDILDLYLNIYKL